MTANPARPAGTGRIRWISVGAFAVWGLLFGTTYSYLDFPPFKWAWGLNLLRYLPDGAAWLLTALALLLTTDEARRGAIALAHRIASAWRALPARVAEATILVAAGSACWMLRDRILGGEQKLILQVLRTPGRAAFPETGGTLLLEWIHGLGRPLGLHGGTALQIAIAVAAALTVWLVVRGARLADTEGRATATIPVLALTGGIGAALAGRLDTQAFQLAAAAAYFYCGLRVLGEPRSPMPAGIALGVLAWLDPMALLLVPSLWLVARGAPGSRRATAIGLAFLPLALHLAGLVAANPSGLPTGEVLLAGLGGARGWVRPPWDGAGLGTDYAFATLPHLKYLANAGFILAGGAVAALVAAALLARSQATASPQLRFLWLCWIGFALGAVTVRATWGPWDWELFATTGLAGSYTAGAWLARASDRDKRSHVLVAVAALQLAFVSVPLVSIGFGPSVDAGAFTERRFDPLLYERERTPPKRIRKWL